MNSSGFSQNVGIGTNTPAFPLDVTSNSYITGNFVSTGTDGTGVQGISITNPGLGWGVYGEAGAVGVEGVALIVGTGDRYGVRGYGQNGTSNNYGVKGFATGGINAYGVYGSASGGSGSTWAGYFNGDVFATNVGIGTTAPAFPLSFAPVLGDKISLWSNSSNSYGFGINSGQLQIHTDISAADVVFGYGSSADLTETMRVKGNGKVGIGTDTPNANLEVNGTFKLTDGTQGAGKILTSDATGQASWQPPPPLVNYQVVWICCNPWMTKNLDVSTYRNGDPIPNVTDEDEWTALTSGAYCYYNNDSTTYAATYGKLYNWHAVNDSRGLAPEGWHIPTDLEWSTLGTCLGGDAVAGGPMKEIGTTHWTTPNTGATNISGFTGLPGGLRFDAGTFTAIGTSGYWWSSTISDANYSWIRYLEHASGSLYRTSSPNRYGFSVRCLRD